MKQREETMPRSRASDVVQQVGHRRLVDAEAVAEYFGFTGKWVNAMARAEKIPWHGVRNGVKVYRRFDLDEVIVALAHSVDANVDNARIVSREVVAPPPPTHVASKRPNGKAMTATAPAAHERACVRAE
jgi:hypothetical protein